MKIFFAYERDDEDIAKKLLEHFALPIRNREIEVWHRGMLLAGSRASIETEKHLHNSDIVLFFLSSDFLASEFYYEIEEEVIRKVKKGKQKLIPILVRSCFWQSTRFNEELSPQLLPMDNQSVLSYESTDEVLFEIASEILKAANQGGTVDRGFDPVPKEENLAFDNVGTLINHLKDLLGKGRTKEVFEILDNVLEGGNSDLKNTVILLKSRYNAAKRDQRMGIVSSENASLTNNKIMYGLLSLIDSIPDELQYGNPEESSIYLDAIKKTSGLEDDQEKYKKVKEQIFDTDQEIDSILKDLAKKFDIRKYPIQAKRLENIQIRYTKLVPNIRGKSPSGDVKRKLDAIRQDLINLVEELQQLESEEKVEASNKDLTTAEVVYLNEVKLIFVGNGEVGKTTIRQNLIEPEYGIKRHDSTEGLEVVSWDLQTSKSVTYRLNIWDFGGQGKYRAIQQFFCTSQALYIFVTTPFEEENLSDDDYVGLDYWLNYVNLFGYDTDRKRESSVIFVMNKCDMGGNQIINEKSILEKFKNVGDFIRISCKSGQGIDELKNIIAKRIEETQIANKQFPGNWVAVKDALQKRSKTDDLLDFDEYLDIFKEKVPFTSSDNREIATHTDDLSRLENDDDVRKQLGEHYDKVQYSSVINFWEEVKEENDWPKQVAERIFLEQNADILIKYLNAIGILLYYPKVASLHNKIILNPDWARQLAYKILDSSYASMGILREESLVKIFSGEERIYCIDLLKTYNLCHEEEINGSITYFIPSLFPEDKPPGLIDFDQLPKVIGYQCSFLPIIPAEFLSRLISKMFSAISEENQFWRYGALLSKEKKNGEKSPKTYAQVLESWRENQIRVAVIGDDWKELLARIVNTIYSVHQEMMASISRKFDIKESLNLGANENFIELSVYRKKENENLLLPIHFEEILNQSKHELTEEDHNSQVEKANNAFKENTENLKKSFLYLAACPNGKTEIRFFSEYGSISDGLKAIRKEHLVTLNHQYQVLASDLFLTIKTAHANYIHFSLHGSRKGELLFIKEKKEEARVDTIEMAEGFEELIRTEKDIHIVCFSACHSFAHAKALSEYVPCTIGMKGFFPDEAAVLFAKIFYSHLFSMGVESVDFCFKKTIRDLRRAGFPAQEEIEVHNMPHIFLNGKLQELNI